MKKFEKWEIENSTAKCFKDFSTYWHEVSNFVEDYLFFKLYMSRNAKSNIQFIPRVSSRSFQFILDSYMENEEELHKAFNIFHIMKQIILDFQDWNKPVYKEQERNDLLRYLVNYEWVDIDVFCNDFISCSHSHAEIRQKIEDVLKENENEES